MRGTPHGIWIKRVLVISVSLSFWLGDAAARDSRLEVSVDSEVTVIPGGLFAYMFRARDGTLVVNGYVGPRPGSPPRPGWGRPLPGPGYALTVHSIDSGRTWQIWAPETNVGISPEKTPRLWQICKYEHCAGRMGPATQGSIVQLRDGTILMYDHEPEPDGDGKFVGRMWRSLDNWKSVIGPEETYVHIPEAVPTIMADNNALCPGMLFWGPVLELPSGALLATMTGRFKQDNTPIRYTEQSSVSSPNMLQDRSIVVRSEDLGRTWRYLATIASPPRGTQEGFNETNVIRLTQGKRRGRLIAVMRTGRQDPFYQAVSDDEGQTWREHRRLDIGGVAPSLIEMSNGILALSFGHKPEYKDDGNFVAFSLDQGTTWTNVTRLSREMTRAYTTVRETRSGDLFVVYSRIEGGGLDLAQRNYGERSLYLSPYCRIAGRVVRVKLNQSVGQ